MDGKNIDMKETIAFVKKHWKIIVIIIIALLLFGIIFQSGRKISALENKNKLQQEQLLASDKVLKEKEIKYAQDSSEWAQEIARYDTLAQDITQQLDASRTDLKDKGALVRRLLREASSQTPNVSDSIDLLVKSKIDSAAMEFDQLSLKYADLEYNMNELIELQIKKDSVQAEQLNSAYAQVKTLRDAYADVFSKYNLLSKDFSKVAKKVKNKRFLNRVLASGVLAIGTMYLLK